MSSGAPPQLDPWPILLLLPDDRRYSVAEQVTVVSDVGTLGCAHTPLPIYVITSVIKTDPSTTQHVYRCYVLI
jgi:hypothetical protein